jgi:hypothetical protein
MASGRRDAEVILMLLQIFVEVPALVIAEIAWYLRVGVALTCLIVLFAVGIAAICLAHHARTESRFLPHGHRPEPLPLP